MTWIEMINDGIERIDEGLKGLMTRIERINDEV